MGQPIKNIIDYEKYFSKDITNLLTYINNEYIQNIPVNEITTEMFFSAAISMDECMLNKTISGYLNSISINTIQTKLSDILQTLTITALKPGRKIEYSQELKTLFAKSLGECKDMGCELITTDHILLALLNTDNGNEYTRVKQIFNDCGLNYNIALERSKKMHDITDSIKDIDEVKPIKIEIMGNPGQIDKMDLLTHLGLNPNQEVKIRTKNGIQYCTNLNEQAKNGYIDDLIGRDKEINRIAKIINRRKSNNVLLIGEAGCGKTAIVEGLAKRITEGNAPLSLNGQTILKFNGNEVMSGTQLRGMLEDRMTNLLKELKKREDVILFIDDFHKFFNEKKDDDYNVTGLILPMLEDSDCKIIATTTYKGYKNAIEKNQDLENRFSRIDVASQTPEECKIIINNLKPLYEKFHHVIFNNDTIDTIITLLQRYSNNKPLLSSAIDVIDEIGSKKSQESIETYEVKSKQNELNEARANGDKEKESTCRLQLTKLLNTKQEPIISVITIDDVYDEIAEYTNIPLTKITASEKESVKNIDFILKQHIIGQNSAIELVSRAIKRNKVGLSPKNKPLATFMCVGKTGVGKTLLAKTLAKEIYGDDKNLVRFDMSEYSDKTSVNKLIGSSAGYIGYNDGGLLTEAIKAKKHCVLLLDEIEKADDEVYNLFLQVFDDGYLTDNTGQKVDFRNAIIILTSNVGTKMASETRSIGFSKDDNETKMDVIEKELKKKFPPEFINRIDEIVYFNALTDDNLKEIIKLELSKLNNRLNDIDYSITYDDNVISYVLEKILPEKEYGARPIIRAIQNLIENKITDLLLGSEYSKNYIFTISYNKEENNLMVK